VAVAELQKPHLHDCPHCEIGAGCAIYTDPKRPQACGAFLCNWLVDNTVSEAWRPVSSGMVICYEPHARRILIYVDEGRGAIWREAPFYADIKHWARVALRGRRQLVVFEGLEAMAILPDRDIPLGPVNPGQEIVTLANTTPRA
jgi:hypothetical protein